MFNNRVDQNYFTSQFLKDKINNSVAKVGQLKCCVFLQKVTKIRLGWATIIYITR